MSLFGNAIGSFIGTTLAHQAANTRRQQQYNGHNSEILSSRIWRRAMPYGDWEEITYQQYLDEVSFDSPEELLITILAFIGGHRSQTQTHEYAVGVMLYE